MTNHNQELGKRGEEIVVRELLKAGFEVLARNLRIGRLGELDVIAQRRGVTHVIEVKTRTSNTFGEPELAVDVRKQQVMRRVWEAARRVHGREWGIGADAAVQFDVGAVVVGQERIELKWYRNIEIG